MSTGGWVPPGAEDGRQSAAPFAGFVVRYVIAGSDSVWLVTYWSQDLATTRPQGDAIAASFDPA